MITMWFREPPMGSSFEVKIYGIIQAQRAWDALVSAGFEALSPRP